MQQFNLNQIHYFISLHLLWDSMNKQIYNFIQKSLYGKDLKLFNELENDVKQQSQLFQVEAGGQD